MILLSPTNCARWFVLFHVQLWICSSRAFLWLLSKSSCPEVFCEKSDFRNFAKFTEKHLCQSLFLNKFLRTPFLTTPPAAATYNEKVYR